MAPPSNNFSFSFNFGDEFGRSTSAQMKAAGKEFVKIIEMYADLATNKGTIQKLNQKLADDMKDAAVVAYRQNVLQARAAPSYRSDDGDRYAGGRLLRALQDPTMAVGTSTGIGFINSGLLDKEAKQWARLNFGAAPGQGRSGSAHPRPNARIRFGGGQGVTLKLSGEMRPGFSVPQRGRGYFLPTGEFFLGKSPSRENVSVPGRPSKSGIAARRFLDQGLVSLANNFGPAYKEHFADALREANSRGKKGRGTNFGPA